ncbi:MAG: hypothetical protein WCV92_01430 [Candidatus Buchananbacteria bacterium]
MDEAKMPRGKNFLVGFIAGFIIMLIISGVVYGLQTFSGKNLTAAKAKQVVQNFVNKDLPQGQAAAQIDSIENFNCGLYKMQISLGEQKAEAYVTKDGTKIFPAAIDISPSSSTDKQVNTQTPQASANVTKSNKPKVELFIMSYCPYGTQIEKGIIPVVEALGNKIDFSLKFVNYAMHDKKEVDENLKQYCIDKTQGDKLMPYLTCFLKAGDSASCLASNGINQGKLDSCISSSDKEFKITENFNNKQTWLGNYPPFNIYKTDAEKYGVQGSPTLVINGAQVETARDSASLLKTICGAFNNAPDACSKASLSSATPAPGFGEGTTANTAAADCATN